MDHAPVHENHQSYCCEPDVLPSCTPCQEILPPRWNVFFSLDAPVLCLTRTLILWPLASRQPCLVCPLNLSVCIGRLRAQCRISLRAQNRHIILWLQLKLHLTIHQTAIWFNIPSVAIHTIKVNGGVGSSRTAISLTLIHEISWECNTIYSLTIHWPSNWNIDQEYPKLAPAFWSLAPRLMTGRKLIYSWDVQSWTISPVTWQL
jgi:hypothetical protein